MSPWTSPQTVLVLALPPSQGIRLIRGDLKKITRMDSFLVVEAERINPYSGAKLWQIACSFPSSEAAQAAERIIDNQAEAEAVVSDITGLIAFNGETAQIWGDASSLSERFFQGKILKQYSDPDEIPVLVRVS